MNILAVLILLCVNTHALIVYDCNGPSTNITAISLRDVAPCEQPNHNYVEEDTTIEIIQKDEYMSVEVFTCLVHVTRHIQHCGAHSHTSAVHEGLLSYVKQIGETECKEMHNSRSYNDFYGYFINNLKPNGTTTRSLTIAGEIEMDGTCHGTEYSENGLSWKDVVVSASVSIKIKNYWATARLDVGEISLMGGVTCLFLEGYCMDPDIGETTWSIANDTECSKAKHTIIYQGKATIIHINDTMLNYLVVEEADRVFALTLIKKGICCSREVWITEHPRLIVAEQSISYNESSEILNNNVNLISYVNSKFMYVEISSKLHTSKMYGQLVYRKCLFQREILQNKLLLAPLASDALMSVIKNEPGYVGKVFGEVLYIIKCIPKVAEIRRISKCFNQLPITVNNESMFMAPLTHIVQKHAEEIDCTSVIPPMYKIDGNWIGFNPNTMTNIEPTVLNPQEPTNLKFHSINDLGSGGLYTQSEIENVQHNIIFGTERKALSNYITRKVIGHSTSTDDFDLANLFNHEEIKKLARSTFSYMREWFVDIGMFTSGILGIVIILIVIKYVIGVILNALSIYKTSGWGLAIFASLWSALTTWVINEKFRQQYQSKANGEEAETAPIVSAVSSTTPPEEHLTASTATIHPKIVIE